MGLVSLAHPWTEGTGVRRREMMRRMAGGTLLALGGCAIAPPGAPPGEIIVAPGLSLVMPTVASLNRRIEVSQLVVARYGAQTVRFEGRISAGPDHFDLLCIDLLGREAVRIHWTGAGIVSHQATWVPEQLRPENMLADIVMLYWPAATVARALAAFGGVLAAEPGRRSVRLHDEEVIRADYQPLAGVDPWNGNAKLHNLAWNYELDIQSRVIGP